MHDICKADLEQIVHTGKGAASLIHLIVLLCQHSCIAGEWEGGSHGSCKILILERRVEVQEMQNMREGERMSLGFYLCFYLFVCLLLKKLLVFDRSP